MAVTKDNVNSTSGTAVTSLSIASFVVANQPNSVLCAFSGAAGAAGPFTHSNWTWNGSTAGFTELNDTTFSTLYSVASALLKSPAAATATVGVTYSGSADEAMFAAYSAYNVDQTTPNSTVRTNSAASGTAWVACDGYANGISLGFSFGDGATSVTPTSGIPKYIGTGSVSQSDGATTLTPTAPTGLRGDLLIAEIAVKNNATISVSGSGWTLVGQTNSGANFTAAWAWRIHDGTNVNPAFSWTGSVACGAIVRQYRDTKADGTPYGTLSTVNTGSTSTHSSTGFNTSVNNVRVIYLDDAAANTALATPAGWTEDADTAGATWAGRTVVGGNEVATAGTASGNISVTGAAAAWTQRQIELLPSDPGAQTQETEIQAIGAAASANLCSETGDTYNTFGWTYVTAGNWGAVAFGLNPAAATSSAVLLNMMGRGLGWGLASGLG